LGNPAATAPLITNFIRSFGGEKGALSDGDIQRFKLNPSLIGKTIDEISKMETGMLSAESIQLLEKAIDGKIKQGNAELAKKAKDYSTRISRLGLNPADVLPGEDLNLLGHKDEQSASQVLGGMGKKRK
jgi:hypothetical protein